MFTNTTSARKLRQINKRKNVRRFSALFGKRRKQFPKWTPPGAPKYFFQIIIRQKHPKILVEFVRMLRDPSLSRINDSLY